MKIGIIGCGVIGGALLKACRVKDMNVVGYDPNKEGLKDFAPILKTQLAFLCLPTPTKGGRQDDSIVEGTLATLAKENYAGVVCVRSTVLPGTTMKFQTAYPTLRLTHCPEFLTAASPFEDLIKQTVVLVGGSNVNDKHVVYDFWRQFDRKTPIRMLDTTEQSEMAKYIHNCFLATKVSFFNDIYELCQVMGIDYKMSLWGALDVGQIGSGHTKVPGPDGELGYGGMCFPKDMNAILNLFAQQGLPAETIAGAAAGNGRRRSKPEDR